MAYGASGLTRMAGGGGYNIWFYSSVDALSVVRASGYFNDAAGMMNVGDVVFIYASNGFGMCTVLSNDGSAIDTGDIVSMTTDSR